MSGLLGPVASTRIKTVDDLPMLVPADALRRQINLEASQSLISLPVRDLGAKILVPKFDLLRQQMTAISQQFPEFTITLTGLAPLAMYASTINIYEMAVSLIAALAAIFLVVVVSLRSLRLGLICMIPNIIPIAGVAALLVITGTPLYYTSVLVFTICLGIAVDDTVHFTLRYRQEYLASQSVETAQYNSIRHIGLVLVFTTSVFGAAFFSLVFSSVGVLKIMGILSFIALGLALLADLVFLPAMLATGFGRRALERRVVKSRAAADS
ncbi:MAG: MMPL family transporter [Gammaproteobacteria bacterium]|nr:MMPL family transporter [Gammaproteobacteria bacterium]